MNIDNLDNLDNNTYFKISSLDEDNEQFRIEIYYEDVKAGFLIFSKQFELIYLFDQVDLEDIFEKFMVF